MKLTILPLFTISLTLATSIIVSAEFLVAPIEAVLFTLL